jgi:hypothetical protein
MLKILAQMLSISDKYRGDYNFYIAAAFSHIQRNKYLFKNEKYKNFYNIICHIGFLPIKALDQDVARRYRSFGINYLTLIFISNDYTYDKPLTNVYVDPESQNKTEVTFITYSQFFNKII